VKALRNKPHCTVIPKFAEGGDGGLTNARLGILKRSKQDGIGRPCLEPGKSPN
jgi:hypothetical protein